MRSSGEQLPATSGYDAFLSYSHALDGVLAPALQSGLERFAKPRRARNVALGFTARFRGTVRPPRPT
ncbi:MAG: hypothetical protein JO272_15065 [Pseudonocardiales bacterium]|nr:hypothetical protein [Pseudonocardiales bacterium]